MQHDFDFYCPPQKYFGQKIKSYSQINDIQKQKIIISGFPYDQGTKINNGRVGGAIGPQIFRNALYQSKLYCNNQIQIYDSGDISQQYQLPKAHQQLFKKHSKIIKQGNNFIISVGGSNDQSFSNARALIQQNKQKKIAVINIDAHFDIRPLVDGKAHSGSPFRLMLQNPQWKPQNIFVQFAAKGMVCSYQHYQYLLSKNGRVYWLNKHIRNKKIKQQNQYLTQGGQLFQQLIQQLKQKVDIIFVSFDLDSIGCKWMPGVSAPNTTGISSSQALQIMKISAKQKKVKMIDFSQFNPAVQSNISSKMIVQLVRQFAQHRK